MKDFKKYLISIVVGFAVAVVFFAFEGLVHESIQYIWFDLFDTAESRLLIIPLIIGLSLLFFGAQHYFDKEEEKADHASLAEKRPATIENFIKVISIGFLSLITGVSLGPEAVLIPAMFIVGGMLAKPSKTNEELMSAVAFVALFAAFFISIPAALLGLFLLKQSTKTKIDSDLIINSLLASVVTVVTLNWFGFDGFVNAPTTDQEYNLFMPFAFVVLALFGAAYAKVLTNVVENINKERKPDSERTWYAKAFIAGLGLALLYLIGGELTQFTGNDAIVPMFSDAKSLGLLGLLWIALIKTFAIGWSRAYGYIGGTIFPTVFVATVFVAIVGLYVDGINPLVGMLIFLSGAIYINRKTHVLF